MMVRRNEHDMGQRRQLLIGRALLETVAKAAAA